MVVHLWRTFEGGVFPTELCLRLFEVVLAKGAEPYLSHESVKGELGYTILEGLCESIVEETNDLGETVIRLTIRQNSI